jgi:hypothetical protein
VCLGGILLVLDGLPMKNIALVKLHFTTKIFLRMSKAQKKVSEKKH